MLESLKEAETGVKSSPGAIITLKYSSFIKIYKLHDYKSPSQIDRGHLLWPGHNVPHTENVAHDS